LSSSRARAARRNALAGLLAGAGLGGAAATVAVRARGRSDELRRFQLLSGVGGVADGSLTLDETVTRLLDLLVPTFADMAAMDALEPSGELRRLGARVAGPDAGEAEAAVLRRQQPARDATFGSLRAAERGVSQLMQDLGPEHLRQIARDEHDLGVLLSLGMRSIVFLPLRARGRTVGALAVAVGRSGRRYDDSDREFAEVLSGRIALALDNAGLSASLSSLERQLEATLASLAEAVTVQGREGTVYANPAAARLIQVESTDDLLGRPRGEILSRFDVFHPDGSQVDIDEFPGARVLAGEAEPEPLLVRNVVKATGQERWLLNKATPVYDEHGKVALAVNVIEDVTEVKRAELAQRLLAEAGEVLSSSLDYGNTLQRVARLAVPQLADWCGVNMPDERGLIRQVAVAHADPEKVALAWRLGERYPNRVDDPEGAAQVIRSGESQMMNEIPEGALADAAVDEEHLRTLQGLGMRAVIMVPLRSGWRTTGVLTLVSAESGRVFDEADLALAEELGRRAGTAVENARLYTERSEIADTLQASLLPPALPEMPGWTIATLYRPAGDENEVGGDFYDAFPVGDGWMVVVGDVAGRGATAAALTSLARYTVRTAGQVLGDPAEAVERLNETLTARTELSLVAICCVLLRERDGVAHATVVCGGHPLPYLLRDGRAQEVGEFGRFAGAFEDSRWEAVDIEVAEGEQLVLHTDGVMDTVGATDRFGENRLAEVIAGAGEPTEVVDRVDRALTEFAVGPQADDTALLAVMRTGDGWSSKPTAAAARGRGAAR
jgi:serine phosphatase RsbU (regulator of sigma subunit)/PAS domain-containing protein